MPSYIPVRIIIINCLELNLYYTHAHIYIYTRVSTIHVHVFYDFESPFLIIALLWVGDMATNDDDDDNRKNI